MALWGLKELKRRESVRKPTRQVHQCGESRLENASCKFTTVHQDERGRTEIV
jgi:hypothetical protein